MTSKPHVVAVVQARMESLRLPGKSLLLLDGKPLIQHVVERIQRAQEVHQVILATTVNPADDGLASFAKSKLQLEVVRGPEDDVLERFSIATRRFRPDLVVRVTADDPLKNPEITDSCIRLLLDKSLQYVSNTLQPTYPEGLDIEVMRAEALLLANEEAVTQSDREHVTPYIWRQPEKFPSTQYTHVMDRSHWRWTLDTMEDANFLEAFLASLRNQGIYDDYASIVSHLESSPILLKMMPQVRRNDGYLRSLQGELDG